MLRTLFLAAIAAAIVTAVRKPSWSSAAPSGAPIAASTRVRRNTAMARLAARRGADRAATSVRSKLASDEQRRRLQAELEAREARDVVDSLGNMKGALMKLGQMASYLDDGMPEPMRLALAELRSDAPPMPGDLALTEIERSLGRPLAEMFSDIDPTPIASASIGQVHRATTRDGRDVAVKVQYPGIADAIGADLKNTQTLGNLLTMIFPGLDSESLVAELQARVGEELDYLNEARNQREFADFYRDHPYIWIPDVIDELSSSDVLTTEFVAGVAFDEAYGLSQQRRNEIAEILYRFVFRSLNRQLAFNADPHPGNYLLANDGRIAFLDFGLVKHFAPDEVLQFTTLIQAMLGGDKAGFRATAEQVDLLRPGAPFSNDEIYEWFTAYYELILNHQEVQITADYSGGLLRQTFDGKTNQILKHANVPPTFALIQRINLGLFSILAKLEATANWRAISEELWPWVDGPPSTPIGVAEAHWVATRAALSSGSAASSGSAPS